MKLTILGRCPSKKNSKIMVCRGKFPMLLPSAKYKEWHTDATLQLAGKKKIESSTITITVYPPDARKADLTNKAESVMDLLVDCGLIEDDNWWVINTLILKFGGIDKVNPRLSIDF
jgi:Holliday junction resolvase RusA-like endonuclease